MAEDAVFNIIIGVQNRERIKQLEQDIKSAEQEISNLSRAINTAGQATEQQANQLRMYGKDIQAYRNEITELTKANIQLGEESGSGIAIRGIRAMERSIIQLDEGAKGLVYTIPQVAAALGASGELTAALAVTAAAIEVTSKHWNDLQEMFDSRRGIDAAKSNLESLAQYLESVPALGAFFGWQAGLQSKYIQEQRRSAISEREEKGGQSIQDMLSEEEKKAGDRFVKAAQSYGPQRLFRETVNREAGAESERTGKPMTASQIAEIEKRVRVQLGESAMGRMPKGAGDLYGPGFEKELESQQQKEDFKLEQKAIREEASEKKAGEAQIEENKKAEKQKQDRWERDQEKIMRSDEEFNKKRQEAILQDQLTDLERQKRGQAEAFREQQMGNKFTFQRGGQAIAEAYQTDAATEISKNQLKVQQDMQKGIDRVRDELTAIRRVGIGATVQ